MVGNLPLMQRINEVAQQEKDTNVPILEAGIQFWTAVADTLEKNHQALGDAANRVAESWRDATHPVAFQDPVNAGLGSLEKSVQTIAQAKPQEAAQKAIGEIEAIALRIAEILAQYIEIYNLAVRLEAKAAANPMGFEAQMLAQLEAKMRELEQQATEELKRMGTQGYAPATPPVKAAGESHAWNGPQSASAASAASAGGSGMVPGGAAASSGPGTPAALDTGQSPDTIPGGSVSDTDLGRTEAGVPTEIDDRSDISLASGPTTAPAPPVAAGPPATAPAGPVGPGAGVPIAPIAGGFGARAAGSGRIPVVPTAVVPGGGRGGSGGQIPQAAKAPGGIASASSGKAPSLPVESGGAVAASGARKPGMIGPMGMGAGVPAMLTPLATDGLQGLINRLKPIVTRPGAARVAAPETVPGVPKGLRGRTARTDDDDAFRLAPRPAIRNRRTGDAPPETVQLLDEEIWRVEQATTNAGAVSPRR